MSRGDSRRTSERGASWKAGYSEELLGKLATVTEVARIFASEKSKNQ